MRNKAVFTLTTALHVILQQGKRCSVWYKGVLRPHTLIPPWCDNERVATEQYLRRAPLMTALGAHEKRSILVRVFRVALGAGRDVVHGVGVFRRRQAILKDRLTEQCTHEKGLWRT